MHPHRQTRFFQKTGFVYSFSLILGRVRTHYELNLRFVVRHLHKSCMINFIYTSWLNEGLVNGETEITHVDVLYLIVLGQRFSITATEHGGL
jgi:hypothetical protein